MVVYTHDGASVFEPGNKEHFDNILSDISPTVTPITTMSKVQMVDSQKWEYWTADLRASGGEDAKANVQGDTPTSVDEGRVEVNNYFMLFQSSVKVADTQEQQKKVGVNSELDWLAGRELTAMKIDLEHAVLGRVKARKPSTNSVAGLMQGIPGIIARWASEVVDAVPLYGANNVTNIDITLADLSGTGAAQGLGRTEAMLQRLWNIGGMPNTMYMSGYDKGLVDAWDASGITRQSREITKIIQRVDVYQGSFGELALIPHRRLSKIGGDGTGFDFDGTAGTMIMDWSIMCNPSMMKLGVYKKDNFHSEDLARTGRFWERMISGQFSYKLDNPAGFGMFAHCEAQAANPVVLPVAAAGYLL